MKKSKAPEVLQAGKDKITAEIEAFGNDIKEAEKINMFE